MKALTFIFNTIFVGLMLLVALLFLVPLLPIEQNLQLRIVESGSMEPSIMTGSLVVILPASSYGLNDVITFESKTADVPTTHRIVDTYEENGRTWFITKGDANEEADTNAVAPESVIGKVMFSAPYAGFILDFARQPIGFALLIVLPAIMIVLGEIEKIWFEVRRRRDAGPEAVEAEDETFGPPPAAVRYTETALRMMDIATPVRYRALPPTLRVEPLKQQVMPARQLVRQSRKTEWATAAMVVFASSIFASVSFLPTTVSYLNDSEVSTENMLAATILDFTAVPDDSTFDFVGSELEDDADGEVDTAIELEPGSLDARFDVFVEHTGGNPVFCNVIDATTVTPFAYTGPITALMGDNVTFAGPFEMGLSLTDESAITDGDVCIIDVVYQAWYFDAESDQGYFDEERTTLTFTYTADEVLIEPFSAPLLRGLSNEPITDEEPPVEPPVDGAAPASEETPELPSEPEEPTEPEPIPEPEEETEPAVPEPEAGEVV